MIEIGLISGVLRSVLGYLKRMQKGEKFNIEKFTTTIVIYALAWILVQQGFSTYGLEQTIQILISVGIGELVREIINVVKNFF